MEEGCNDMVNGGVGVLTEKSNASQHLTILRGTAMILGVPTTRKASDRWVFLTTFYRGGVGWTWKNEGWGGAAGGTAPT
eukprot:752736-Hanusia_phi.AAC.6